MTERIAEAPPNPFRFMGGNPEYVEYTQPLTTPMLDAEGKRTFRTVEQSMQLQKGIQPYEQVRQLMERCRFLEEENARLTAELDAATAPEEEGGRKKSVRKG